MLRIRCVDPDSCRSFVRRLDTFRGYESESGTGHSKRNDKDEVAFEYIEVSCPRDSGWFAPFLLRLRPVAAAHGWSWQSGIRRKRRITNGLLW